MADKAHFLTAIRATAQRDDAPRPVATPFWPAIDGQLYLRPLNAAERISASGSDRFWARVLAAAFCDESGERIFATIDEGEEELSNQQPAMAEALVKLFDQVREWCFPSVKDLEKNSESGPSCNSPTGSGSPSESPTSSAPEDCSNDSAAASSPAG